MSYKKLGFAFCARVTHEALGELIERFHKFSAPVFSESRRREIIAKVRSVEAEAAISNLTSLFVKET
ncbi:MAG TPA: hypothetical protein G4O03_07110 [Dehalococcoidia bacterium]|jgi:uncharacterized metal-binding protein|nr:hypothetical protein [Dehalococcoidia bacterium]